MNTKMKHYGIPGTLKRPARSEESVTFWISAESRQDALFQARHGSIMATVGRDFPGAKFTYDLRRMKQGEPE